MIPCVQKHWDRHKIKFLVGSEEFRNFLKKNAFFLKKIYNFHSIHNIALIQKIKALSFLQFFLKFHGMHSKWHFEQDLDALWHAGDIFYLFFFTHMWQNCPNAKNHEATSKTEAKFLNFKKNWRKESALIFWIEAR